MGEGRVRRVERVALMYAHHHHHVSTKYLMGSSCRTYGVSGCSVLAWGAGMG